MNLFKIKIISWIAVLAVGPHFVCAQTQPGQSPVASADKLEIETIASVPLPNRQNLLLRMDGREREKFAQQFRDLPAGGPSNAKINALFMAWGAIDPVAAIASAKTFPTPDTRRVAVEALLFGVRPEGAAKIAPSIKSFPDDFLPPEQKQRLLALAIVKWSQTDPSRAAQFFAEVYPDAGSRLAKPGAGDGDLIVATKGVATNWGAASPEAAIEWFHKNVRPDSLVAMQGLVTGWWHKDAKAASAYVRSHTTTPIEREVAGAMAGPLAEQDPRTSLQWVEWIRDERVRSQTRLEIVKLWATQDPKAAGDWARALSGKETDGVVAVVADVWAVSDGAAAEKWVQTLKGQTHDAGIRGYAITTATKDPKAALSWAIKIKDQEMRMRLMTAIATAWSKDKPAESKAWIEQNKQLSKADKQRLLSGEVD